MREKSESRLQSEMIGRVKVPRIIDLLVAGYADRLSLKVGATVDGDSVESHPSVVEGQHHVDHRIHLRVPGVAHFRLGPTIPKAVSMQESSLSSEMKVQVPQEDHSVLG